jgi:hypothetical protein
MNSRSTGDEVLIIIVSTTESESIVVGIGSFSSYPKLESKTKPCCLRFSNSPSMRREARALPRVLINGAATINNLKLQFYFLTVLGEKKACYLFHHMSKFITW